jgi:hypothetical protein
MKVKNTHNFQIWYWHGPQSNAGRLHVLYITNKSAQELSFVSAMVCLLIRIWGVY